MKSTKTNINKIPFIYSNFRINPYIDNPYIDYLGLPGRNAMSNNYKSPIWVTDSIYRIIVGTNSSMISKIHWKDSVI